jgi:hypothetical protein
LRFHDRVAVGRETPTVFVLESCSLAVHVSGRVCRRVEMAMKRVARPPLSCRKLRRLARPKRRSVGARSRAWLSCNKTTIGRACATYDTRVSVRLVVSRRHRLAVRNATPPRALRSEGAVAPRGPRERVRARELVANGDPRIGKGAGEEAPGFREPVTPIDGPPPLWQKPPRKRMAAHLEPVSCLKRPGREAPRLEPRKKKTLENAREVIDTPRETGR